MLPEHVLPRLYARIRPQWKTAFFSAFLTGLLIHLYRLTNPLLTWDSLYNFHDPQNTIHLGRCFLTLGCGISSYYDLPAVNGLLSLLYLSLTAVCLTEFFELESRLSIFLTAAVTVSFPAVASTLLYMYTADGYFLAMLCAALAALLTLRFRRGFLPGILLLCFSCGCYQAYAAYAVVLILSWGIRTLLLTDLPLRDFLRQCARFLCMMAGGMLLYLVCNRLLTALQGVDASSYQGISSMQAPGAAQFLHAAASSLTEFAYFFLGSLHTVSLYQALGLLALLLLAAAFLYAARPRFAQPARLLTACLFLLLLPFGCCMVYFVSPSVRYHMLMMMPFSLIYLLPLFLTDRRAARSRLLSWSCVCLLLLCVYEFSLVDNISYLYAHRSYEETYAMAVQMADRIEQTEGFENASKLCVLGHLPGHDDIDLSLPPRMTGIKEGVLVSEQDHFAAFFTEWLGLPLEGCSKKQAGELASDPALQQMDIWPGTDSVRIVDDVVVIRIGET